MDQAAPQAIRGTVADGPRGDATRTPGPRLAALQWAWDGVYLIGVHPDGGLVVTRADGGGSFHAAGVVEARDEILADYGRRPVACWPLAEGALDRRLEFQRAHPEVAWDVPSLYHRATWTAGGKSYEVTAVSVDKLLAVLRRRGFTW
jgi:hypothetical protein